MKYKNEYKNVKNKKTNLGIIILLAFFYLKYK